MKLKAQLKYTGLASAFFRTGLHTEMHPGQAFIRITVRAATVLRLNRL